MAEHRGPAGGYRLGVSVDGDHVSGALVDTDGGVVAVAAKRLTTQPSLPAVLDAVLDPLIAGAATRGLTVRDVDRVMFAVRQVDGLAVFPLADSPQLRPVLSEVEPVAVVRLGAATTAVPPLALWPPEIRDRVCLAARCVAGGAMLDGTEFEPLDEASLVDFARDIAGRAAAVAVTGVFSSVTPRHELAAAAILTEELGGSVPVVLSHECGGLGLVERENATVLQAALTGPASRRAAWLQSALAEHGLGHAEVFFARTDGTVMALDYTATHPLLLYGGADAATARGVARLAGISDALVALAYPDGTLRAVCSVTAGQPRLTSRHASIVGVPASLRVIALVPTPPGGDGRGAGTVEVRAVADAVDRAKDAPGDLPLLLGGPGAEELAEVLPLRLEGTVGVRCPAWAQAAAAVGVATAPVSGEAERIVTVSADKANDTRYTVCEEARAIAVLAGADPRHVTVALVEESPLMYLADPTIMLRARAEGPPRSDDVMARRAAGMTGNEQQRRPAVAPLGGPDGG